MAAVLACGPLAMSSHRAARVVVGTGGLAVEVDGFGPHSSREAFQSDRERQNVLVPAGRTVLRFTWADVRDRPAEAVGRALAASRPA